MARDDSNYESGQLPGKPLGKRLKIVIAAIVALLLTIPVTLAMPLAKTPAVKLSPEQAKPRVNMSNDLGNSKPIGCPEILVDPKKRIESWLSGNTESKLQIAELQRLQIGGVQSRLIQVSCDAKSATLRLTLVLRKKIWTLKEFARLDN